MNGADEHVRRYLDSCRFHPFSYGSEDYRGPVSEDMRALCAPFTPYILGDQNEKIGNKREAAAFFEIMSMRTIPNDGRVDPSSFLEYVFASDSRLKWLYAKDLVESLASARDSGKFSLACEMRGILAGMVSPNPDEVIASYDAMGKFMRTNVRVPEVEKYIQKTGINVEPEETSPAALPEINNNMKS